MLADAEQTTVECPAAASAAAAAAVFAADDPSSAVLRAQAEAEAYQEGERTKARWAADFAKLDQHLHAVQSEGLRRLLEGAKALKAAEGAAALRHAQAQVFEYAVERGGGTVDEIEAAQAANVEAEEAYMAARKATEAAATRVSYGPFSDIGDALVRADAFACLVGTAENDLPDLDEDVIAMGESYRDALCALHRRQPEAPPLPTGKPGSVQPLLDELKLRWSAEDLSPTDEAIEDDCAKTAEIAEQIMALPAASIEVLRAKAQAVLWCFNDRAFFETCRAGASSTAEQFMYRIISDLLVPAPEASGDLHQQPDVWAEKLAERNRLVDYVNAAVHALPDDVDVDAYVAPEFERGWALTCEIYDAPSSNPQVRAAQVRLCLKMDEEGLDMAERSLELLRQIEKDELTPVGVSGSPDAHSTVIDNRETAR